MAIIVRSTNYMAGRMTIQMRQLNRLLSQVRRISNRTGGEVAPGSGRQTDLSGLGPRRFYKDVDVKREEDGSFAVTVDGKRVRTPRRTILSTPSERLSIALAAEWDAQTERIRPSSMPLTTLVGTAKDIVPEFRDRICASALKYLDTDTVCIRPAYPSELVEKQDMLYAPVVQHLESRGLKPNVTRGALEAPQTETVVSCLTDFVEQLDDYSLAALDSATSSAKSLAIAVALHDAAIDAKQAVAAARSEEQWQANVWGVVEGGHDMDDADILVRLAAADTVFRFVQLDRELFLGLQNSQTR